MTNTLKKAIADSGLPMLRLANQSGVLRQSLMRFVAGKSSLHLDGADKLAAFFGLELRPVRRGKKGR